MHVPPMPFHTCELKSDLRGIEMLMADSAIQMVSLRLKSDLRGIEIIMCIIIQKHIQMVKIRP